MGILKFTELVLYSAIKMSEDGSVMVLDACTLTVQPEEQCGYFGKYPFSFFCKPTVHGHMFY